MQISPQTINARRLAWSALLLAVFASALLLGNQNAHANPTPIGRWKTIDDKTKQPKSIVKIFLKDGKLFGVIEKLFRKPPEELDPKCDKCTDHRKDKRVIGMEILSGMSPKNNEKTWWGNGKILDPGNGKVYGCDIWVEKDNQTLKVRGWVFVFNRTQTWHRVDNNNDAPAPRKDTPAPAQPTPRK